MAVAADRASGAEETKELLSVAGKAPGIPICGAGAGPGPGPEPGPGSGTGTTPPSRLPDPPKPLKGVAT